MYLLPARFGAVVGRLERAPDSQDECSAALVCKRDKNQTFQQSIPQLKLMSLTAHT